MRFFTALTACALMMGACSEAGNYVMMDEAGTRAGGNGNGGNGGGGNGELVGFHKVVQIAEGEFRPAAAGEFTFELWSVKNNGNAELEGVVSTDGNGDVWFDDDPKLHGQGRTYFFREIFASDDEAAKWESLADLPFRLESNWGTHWGESLGSHPYNEGPTVVNIPVPEGEEPVLGPWITSVTLSNGAYGDASVWPGTNHFCYAALTREQLVEGVTLEAVEGNPCNDTGDAFVQLVDGKIVVTINGVGEVCIFAQTEEPVEIDNGQPHSRRGHENFDQEFSVDCPQGDIIYLYVHMNLRFYL